MLYWLIIFVLYFIYIHIIYIEQTINLAEELHDILQPWMTNFLNWTTGNLDGTISYVYKSDTTSEPAAAKPLHKNS